MPTASKRRKNEQAEPVSTVMTLEPDAIAQRAYELYLERGAEPGRDVDDWLQAERELLATCAPAAS